MCFPTIWTWATQLQSGFWLSERRLLFLLLQWVARPSPSVQSRLERALRTQQGVPYRGIITSASGSLHD